MHVIGYNSRINFYNFYCVLDLIIFRLRYMYYESRGYLMSAIAPTVLCRSFLNCTGVFDMGYKFACEPYIIIRLLFITFPRFEINILWSLHSFLHQLLWSQLNLFDYLLMNVNRWMSGKQCRPWSDAAVCGVRSGSTLFIQGCVSQYLE